MPGTSQLHNTNRVVPEALSLQRLPKLETKVFKGAEMEFLHWESSFDALVASHTNDPITMLHYLCKFLKAEPLRIVEHYQDLHHDTDTAYCRAQCRDTDMGMPATILTTSIDKKLTGWPKIGRDSNRELLHSSNFLNQVEVSMNKHTALKFFDSTRELVKLAEKLPGWAQNEWKKKVWQHKETNGNESFPSLCFAETLKMLPR